MILRGGENISPYEVEEVLRLHPAVADAACFAMKDDKYGEVVGAAIEVSAPVEDRALRDHCMERLAAFKVPASFHVLKGIPRTPTGKIQRRMISRIVSANK